MTDLLRRHGRCGHPVYIYIYVDIHRLRCVHRGPYNNLVAVCLATEVSFIVISVVSKRRSEKGTPSRGVSLQASLLLFASC